MDDPTPTPDDDRILQRLAEAGPVLDRLYAEAADAAPEPLPGQPHGLRRPPRRRRPDRSRRRAFAGAIVVLVAAVVAVGLFAARGDDRTITTDEPTTTVAPDPSLAALVRERIDGFEECGPAPTEAEWPRPWPSGWQLVNASNCDVGWIETGIEAVQPIPVVADPETTPRQTIAYWSPSTGWISVKEWEDPAFDLAAYRAAYLAELSARGSTTSTTTG